MTATSFGHQRERQVKARMEDEGWVVIRSPASLGRFDLLALKAGSTPRMVEVKGTAAGPYAGFPPHCRSLLRQEAEQAGAEAWLAWWPKRGQLRWVASDDWPTAKEAA